MEMHRGYLITVTFLANVHINKLFLGLHPNKRRATNYSKENTVDFLSVK